MQKILGMVMVTLLAISLLLLSTGCDLSGSNDGTESTTYAIGDFGPSGVGKVFYITDGGVHGLEAAPVDQSTSAAWATTSGFAGTEDEIGTGSANTDAIIVHENNSDLAAQLCRNFRVAEEGDWFLPSKNELNELYLNKTVVGGFDNSSYWSSSETTSIKALSQDFSNGDQINDINKSTELRVRAVRAF